MSASCPVFARLYLEPKEVLSYEIDARSLFVFYFIFYFFPAATCFWCRASRCEGDGMFRGFDFDGGP